jgi:hypothetical protein
MKDKGKEIILNVKTCWIGMFNLTKKVMAMYMPSLAKMVENNP